ncbi:hypothetical protein AB0M54_18810 [Actinoplanes sp. NPDC051470]|uniref:hypothetical protein n=1 Tax=unclassified Actinoplanes TaxID=2626549 RepID=UPI00342370BA
MSRTRPDEVLRILQEFVNRIDQFDPDAPELGALEIGWRGATERLTIRPPVAHALAEALAAYHDPRDNGACAHCATGRLDSNLMCRSCGIVHGVFGQTLARFAQEQTALDDPRPNRPALEGPSHDR